MATPADDHPRRPSALPPAKRASKLNINLPKFKKCFSAMRMQVYFIDKYRLKAQAIA